jgi:hypothetical protein
MIPVIYQLQQAHLNVIIAADGNALELLKTEFPDLEFIHLPSFSIRYSRKPSQTLKMILQVPKIIIGTIKEYRWLNNLIKVYPVAIVISDNRYGLWNKKILSIFISHQISPFLPAGLKCFEPLMHNIFRFFIKMFDRCWIPDIENPSMNLTGMLSHRYPLPANSAFMGILSRFNNFSASPGKKYSIRKYDILVLLSGPEPQRTLLEEIMLEQLQDTEYKSAFILGLPISASRHIKKPSPKIDLYYHLSPEIFGNLVLNAEVIICRSGYSTIMDLVEMSRPAILIPTPGQPEQEYLASYLSEQGLFHSVSQQNFNLQKALQSYKLKKFNTLSIPKTKVENYLLDILELYNHNKINRKQSGQKSQIHLCGGMGVQP